MPLSRKDIEVMKADIERYALEIIGSDSSDVVDLAMSCLYRDYDTKKTISKLSHLVSESRATKFAEKVFSYVDKVRNSKKRRLEVNEEDQQTEKNKSKKIKTDEPSTAPAPPNINKIKEMMEKAQKEIQQRKAQLNLTTPQSTPTVAASQQINDDTSDRLKRASELQARIQARLQSSGIKDVIGQIPPMPTNVQTSIIFDDSGRAIDTKTGQPVQMQMYTPTLKANMKTVKKEQAKEKPKEEAPQPSKFVDNRISLKPAMRYKKNLNFIEPGKFVKVGNMMRAKNQLEKLQNEVAMAAKKTGIATAAKLAIVQPKQEDVGDVPVLEWWDTIILKADTYPESSEHSQANLKELINYDAITNLIEHPSQMKPPVDRNQKVELPLMLTKKETKKLRKQNRAEAQKEIQEKIRLGLMQPVGPKVKMSNLMRVLGTEAVQDPTKVEMYVRAQMTKRQKDHEEANAARKLTKEQLREKKIKKMKEDTSSGVVVAVYRIRDLSDKKKQYKVQINADQLNMTGIVVVYSGCTVVVVEGGRKQQDKYKKLMMRRIKWESGKVSDNSDDEGDVESAKPNDCKLVWEGYVKNRAFGEVKFRFCPSEAYAKEQFKKHSVEHYWDLAFSTTVLENTE